MAYERTTEYWRDVKTGDKVEHGGETYEVAKNIPHPASPTSHRKVDVYTPVGDEKILEPMSERQVYVYRGKGEKK